MKKLVCDRCGFALIDRRDILLALEGKKAWEDAVRTRGGDPRGVFPCMNFIRCGGEIKRDINGGIFRWRRRVIKSPGRKGKP